MLLPSGAQIGSVHLRVSNLARSLEFYETHLGFCTHPISEGVVNLMAREGGPVILRLTEDPQAQPRPPRTTGLFHAAIRLPSRPALGSVLRRLVEHDVELDGFSDHGVSEAIYLSDPDGIGLELYADRPREQWPLSNGDVEMTTRPLDIRSLMADAGADRHVHPDTDLGHVHLQVSDLRRTEEFYAGELGFHVTQRDYPGALFFAAGDYHHHIGTNTWAGRGAPQPPRNSVGLISYSMLIPSAEEDAWTRVVHDPDGIEIELIYTEPDATTTQRSINSEQ